VSPTKAQVHHDTRKETRLGDTEKNPYHDESFIARHGGGTYRDDTPRDHDTGDPFGGCKVFEATRSAGRGSAPCEKEGGRDSRDVAWKLEQYVGSEVYVYFVSGGTD
jgi:hypothetical protein